MTVAVKENGRSIPDNDLDMIDRTWGDEIPRVKSAVQKMWGVSVSDAAAMELEQRIAEDIHAYTLEEGKALSRSEARILLQLAPCMVGDPYAMGVEWTDVPGAARVLGLSEGHLRRMLIDDKITVRMIRRPSAGKMAEKRWLSVADLKGAR